MGDAATVADCASIPIMDRADREARRARLRASVFLRAHYKTVVCGAGATLGTRESHSSNRDATADKEWGSE